jgi:hypothetical protein
MSENSKQAIAGVAPVEFKETTVMVTWPTIGEFWIGRKIGELLYNPDRTSGISAIINFKHLLALFLAPLGLKLYIFRFLPGVGCRYRITNKRIVVERLYGGKELSSVDLDQFDRIEVNVLPGQEWYPCGELTFYRGNVETFHLSGVSRADTFSMPC